MKSNYITIINEPCELNTIDNVIINSTVELNRGDSCILNGYCRTNRGDRCVINGIIDINIGDKCIINGICKDNKGDLCTINIRRVCEKKRLIEKIDKNPRKKRRVEINAFKKDTFIYDILDIPLQDRVRIRLSMERQDYDIVLLEPDWIGINEYLSVYDFITNHIIPEYYCRDVVHMLRFDAVLCSMCGHQVGSYSTKDNILFCDCCKDDSSGLKKLVCSICNNTPAPFIVPLDLASTKVQELCAECLDYDKDRKVMWAVNNGRGVDRESWEFTKIPKLPDGSWDDEHFNLPEHEREKIKQHHTHCYRIFSSGYRNVEVWKLWLLVKDEI